MGFIKNIGKGQEKAKSILKKIRNVKIFIKLAPIVIVSTILVGAFSWLIEVYDAEQTPKAIYDIAEVENVNELIQIKGNEDDGYHLEFVDNIDEKLDAIIKELNNKAGVYTIDNKELLKKMFKAEIITQFPNLGGQVDSEKEQFQGAIKVRRITPDKEIGEMKNTGAGDKTTSEDLKKENIENQPNGQINYEKGETVKVTKSSTNVYVKGTYDLITKKKKGDSGITLKSLLSLRDFENKQTRLTIGNEVYYTGENLIDGKNTYIEVAEEKDGAVIGYINNANTDKSIENQTNKNNSSSSSNTSEDLKEQKIENQPSGQINYEKGEALKVTKAFTNVYVKGTYDLITKKKKSDDGITTKSLLSLEDFENKKTSLTIGNEVYYTGENLIGSKDTYIEVAEERYGAVIGYINNANVERSIENQTNRDNTSNNSNSSNTSTNSSSSNNENARTIGDPNKTYVLAIAAGHNNSDDTGARSGDFIEENMTIQVAEKVEQLAKQYSNIEIKQTGSTSQNPSNVKMEERVDLAQNVNPDLCIQIHFNATEEGLASGVETWYETGDGYSQKLAECVVNKMAENMGMENRSVKSHEGTSDYFTIIDHYYQTGFPSIITEGGFLDNASDQQKISNGGIDQYAKSILEGSIEYLTGEYENIEVSFLEQNDTYSRVRSRIHDLKYVPEETFNNYVNSGDTKVLDLYTLDDQGKLITAKWEVENGKITILKNSGMNFRSILQKVTTPYEYLLFYLIDSESKKFVNDFADMIINDTEIVMAVKDEITTTKVNVSIEESTQILSDTGNGAGNFGRGWQQTSTEGSKETEKCSTSVGISYADTWISKYAKGTTYSAESLGTDKDEFIDVIKNIKGTLNENTIIDLEGYDNGVATSDVLTGSYSRATDTYTYTYQIFQRKRTETHTISNKYEEGEVIVDGKDDKNNGFIKLYNDYKMSGIISEEWLFGIIEDNSRTANLLDLTKYLFYVASDRKTRYGVTDYEYSEFEISEFSPNNASRGGISLTTSIFTREVFIEAMEAYGTKSGNQNFITNFMPYAGEIYDVSVASGVNPELVVVTAKTEQNFQAGGGANNYWGIGVYNGSNSGGSYASLADGIRAYAEVMHSYGPNGEFAAKITEVYEQRKSSGCDPLGYGLPGTLSGMQSIYSFLGTHEYGSSGAGGYYYMDPARAGVTKIYSTHEEFLEKCYNAGGEHAAGTPTTPWEQGQYTAWQLEGKIETWNEIFGDYGTLGGSGGDFLEAAKRVWEKVCQQNPAYGGSMIPADGTGTIDCSAYVSWALYEYGYVEFEGWQHNTARLIDINWTEKYGWEEINIQAGENVIDQLQPGDILVRGVGSGALGHTLIVVDASNGVLMAYDCGSQSSWSGNTDAHPVEQTYFASYGWPGKIIRVTPPSQ